jgi:glycerate-2-kinase
MPDKNSVNGVNLMLKTLKNITENDLIIFLISGGASSLLISPADGISLEDYQNLVDSLLKKGANIDELNTVRKHIDNIKGGKILKNCFPATVISLLLSDVIDDNLSVIGSGLTAQDFTNYSDAINILKKYRVWKLTSSNLREYLIKGLESEKNGKNKINNKYFERVKNFVVGSNNDSVEAAFNESNSLGYNSMILTTNASGEAKYAGLLYSSIAKEVFLHDRPLKKPAAIIVGGETTVTVKGKGVGGRNQELVLSAASKISNTPCVIASIGTDGIDGNSNAAGAIADGETTNRAYTLKINPLKMLNINDSNTFFQRLNDTIITGYTGTNVNDLSIILIGLD